MAKSFLRYYGGKARLASKIVDIMPEHRLYCEPFCGGGAVFFNKPLASINVLNDKNAMIANFYKQCKTNTEELYKAIDGLPYAESVYRHYKNIYEMYITQIHYNPIEAAVSVFVLSKMSISGNLGSGFSYPVGVDKDVNTRRWVNSKLDFLEYCRILDSATILCRDALQIIKRFDGPDVLFYCDPPYVGANQGHYSGYSGLQFNKFLETIKNIKGKYILSTYSNPYTNTFLSNDGVYVTEHSVITTASVQQSIDIDKDRVELLITNFNTGDNSEQRVSMQI